MFLLKRLCALGLTVVVAATAACSGSSGGGRSRDTLVVYTGQAGDFQLNFNPYAPTQIEGIGTIYESLFFYNIAKDQPPKPLLGTEFSWNADGTELSIALREGVSWSDGQKFTAKDVVFTLDMVARTPAMNRTGFKGTATATDDTHVVVKFPEPAYMDGPQVLGQLWIMPEHIWKNYSAPATEVNRQPVGTGPFALGDFKAQSFTLRANPTYWGGEPALKQVRYLSLSGNQAGVDALKAGSVDWQTGPIPDIKDIEKNYPGYQAVTLPLNQVALFTCSNAQLGCQGAQTDPAVRRAIYYGMNRTQVNSLAFQNINSEMSPGFTLLPRDTALVSSKLTDRMAPMSAGDRQGERAAHLRRLRQGRGRHLRQGRETAGADREGGRRLDRLHHRAGDAEPAAAPDRRQDHAAAAVVERVGRRPWPWPVRAADRLGGAGPRALTRTTPTATSSPPRPRRRSGRRPPRTSRGSATPPWTTRSPS